MRSFALLRWLPLQLQTFIHQLLPPQLALLVSAIHSAYQTPLLSSTEHWPNRCQVRAQKNRLLGPPFAELPYLTLQLKLCCCGSVRCVRRQIWSAPPLASNVPHQSMQVTGFECPPSTCIGRAWLRWYTAVPERLGTAKSWPAMSTHKSAARSTPFSLNAPPSYSYLQQVRNEIETKKRHHNITRK